MYEHIMQLYTNPYKATRSAVAERTAVMESANVERVNSDTSYRNNVDNSAEMEYTGNENTAREEAVTLEDNKVKVENINDREKAIPDTRNAESRGRVAKKSPEEKAAIENKLREKFRRYYENRPSRRAILGSMSTEEEQQE